MKASLVLCLVLVAVLSAKAQLSSTETPTTTAYTVLNTVTQAVTTPSPTTVPSTPQSTPNPTNPDTSTLSTPVPTTPLPTSPRAPFSPSQIMCPVGWEFFQGRCYYFVNEGMTWPQAQSNCALLGSMLVSVHSTQEYGFLQQLTSNNQWADTWLGGFYLQDQWLWLDGTWFYNTSWANESPDSSNPCLMLNYNEAWSNSPCYASGFSSICAKYTNVPPEMMCPTGWMGFQGRCYYYNSASLTWPEAVTNCASLDASLVSIHSPEEYGYLYQQVSTSAWLGGFYFDDQWMWLDGSWFYEGFFYQMSPDSTNQCVSTVSQYGWGSYDCTQALPSFCVKDFLSYME